MGRTGIIALLVICAVSIDAFTIGDIRFKAGEGCVITIYKNNPGEFTSNDLRSLKLKSTSKYCFTLNDSKKQYCNGTHNVVVQTAESPEGKFYGILKVKFEALPVDVSDTSVLTFSADFDGEVNDNSCATHVIGTMTFEPKESCNIIIAKIGGRLNFNRAERASLKIKTDNRNCVYNLKDLDTPQGPELLEVEYCGPIEKHITSTRKIVESREEKLHIRMRIPPKKCQSNDERDIKFIGNFKGKIDSITCDVENVPVPQGQKSSSINQSAYSLSFPSMLSLAYLIVKLNGRKT